MAGLAPQLPGSHAGLVEGGPRTCHFARAERPDRDPHHTGRRRSAWCRGLMAYSVITPDQFDWITRPHAEGEPARHVAELSEVAGFADVRANLWRYEPGAKGRRHRHPTQEETFVVLSGTLSMYVGDPPTRENVPAGADHRQARHGPPERQSRRLGTAGLRVRLPAQEPERRAAALRRQSAVAADDLPQLPFASACRAGAAAGGKPRGVRGRGIKMAKEEAAGIERALSGGARGRALLRMDRRATRGSYERYFLQRFTPRGREEVVADPARRPSGRSPTEDARRRPRRGRAGEGRTVAGSRPTRGRGASPCPTTSSASSTRGRGPGLSSPSSAAEPRRDPYRLQDAKRPERVRAAAKFVAMLERGETVYPQARRGA